MLYSVEKVIASKSYRSGLKEDVVATYSSPSSNILGIIASKRYCVDSWAKAIPLNAVIF
jgi:hypothetical protein